MKDKQEDRRLLADVPGLKEMTDTILGKLKKLKPQFKKGNGLIKFIDTKSKP